MSTHNRKNIQQIELVETYNIYLSLKRLMTVYNYTRAPARSLYHALCMCGAFDKDAREKIRQAIEA